MQAPREHRRCSTSLSISSAVFPSASYVEWAPASKVTAKPAASAPLQVASTQYSLWRPHATISSTPAARSRCARSGFDSNVSPAADRQTTVSLPEGMPDFSPVVCYLPVFFATSISSSTPGRGLNTSSTAHCPSPMNHLPVIPRAGRKR